VQYQPRPAYYYYPQPYPVYYYPYAANHHFNRGFFWGVTTAFSIGWYTDSLNVYHHSYRGHPYYGRTYWNDGWYRQPSINVYNTTYVNHTNGAANRHSKGDPWSARDHRRKYVRREGYARAEKRSPHRSTASSRQHEPIAFRERESRTVNSHSTRRNDAIKQYRGDRSHASKERDRVVQHRSGIERARETSRAARRQDTVVRTREASHETTANRSRRTSAHNPEPARQRSDHAPARTTVRTPAPAPRERRHTESRPKNHSGSSNKSARRSSEHRNRSADRHR